MKDIFDTLTSNTATLDIFDELSPENEGDIFDQITQSKSKVSTLGIIKKSLQQAPMSAAQSIGGIARAIGDITGIESVKQYGEDVYKGAEIELEKERPEMETALQKGIYGATQSIAQNMPGLALSAVTGSPIPALLAAGTLAGGREYGEAREAGVSPVKAGAGAAGTTISEVATEYIPLGYLLQPGLSLAKRMLFSTISELVGENINTVAQKAIQWWERNPDKTTGEFVAELYPDTKQTSLQVLLSSPVMALGGQALTRLTPTTKAVTGKAEADLITEGIKPPLEVTTQPKDIFDELQPENVEIVKPQMKKSLKPDMVINMYEGDKTFWKNLTPEIRGLIEKYRVHLNRNKENWAETIDLHTGRPEIIIGTMGLTENDIKTTILHEVGHIKTYEEGEIHPEFHKNNSENVARELEAWQWAIDNAKDYGHEITPNELSKHKESVRSLISQLEFPKQKPKDITPPVVSKELWQMTKSEYVDTFNPTKEDISAEKRPVLHIGDMEGMAEGKKYTSKKLSSGELLQLIKDENNNIYAKIGKDTVGFATELGDGSTDLSVAQEFQKKGIGTILLSEYKKFNPKAIAGGLTLSGKKTTESVHKMIIKQAISEGKPVPPEVLKDYPDLKQETTSVKLYKLKDLPVDIQEKAKYYFKTDTGTLEGSDLHYYDKEGRPIGDDSEYPINEYRERLLEHEALFKKGKEMEADIQGQQKLFGKAQYKDYQAIHEAVKKGKLKIGDTTTTSAYGGKVVEIVPTQKGEIDSIGLPIKYRIEIKGEIVREPYSNVLEEPLPKPEGEVKAGSLAFGMDLPKYTSSINLNNWDTTYDVKKLTSDIVEKSGIQKTKKTFAQIRQEAEEIGMTEKQLVKKKNIPIDKMSAEITAMRDIAVNTVQQTRHVMDEALKIATDETKSQDIRDEALTVALLKMSKAGTVLKQVSGTSSEIGRALSAHRMKVDAYKATKNYKAMLDAIGGREVGIEILKKFAGIDPNNTKATVQFIRDVQQAKTMDMVYEAWRNAILSSPKTIITNAISNTVTMMTKPVESFTAASLEAGKQLVTGKPRKVFFGEVKAETLGAIQGIKEGFKTGLQSFVTELPSDTETKIEMAKGTAIPGKTGRIIRYPQRLLMATDEMFKAMMYRSELNSLAYRKASLEGKRGQERIDAMAEYLLNPTEEMIKKSRNESLYRTYNKPLGKFGNQVMQLRESDPSGTLKYILPFIRTPVNIFKFGLERTPINFARLGYLISKGKITDDMAEELSKPLLGSAIGMGIAMLAAQGFITGGAPKEKEKKDALYRTGWQPYSFKIGDKYIPYNRIEPLGSIVGSVADYVELFKDKKPTEIDEMAGRIATSIAKNWTNKTFLLGLSNAINAIQDPERYGENLIQSFAGSLVPNIVATTAKAIDETLRQPRTVLEAMKTRIPYLDRSVLSRQDIWGRDVQKFGKGIIGKVSRGMSPIVISEASKDPVDIEMARLLQTTDMAISLPQERIQGIKLPPELYREYVQKSGELAYKLINSAIATPEYQKLQDDEIKYKVIRNTIDKARDAYKPVIINKIFETPKYKHLIPKNLNLR